MTSVAASPCVELEGNPVQGGVLWGQTAPHAEIRFAGIQVPVFNDGHFLLGLGRDMPAVNELVVTTHDACAQEVRVAARDGFAPNARRWVSRSAAGRPQCAAPDTLWPRP